MERIVYSTPWRIRSNKLTMVLLGDGVHFGKHEDVLQSMRREVLAELDNWAKPRRWSPEVAIGA